MKKHIAILSFAVLAVVPSLSHSQDTVKYMDPWYQFNPMPQLKEYPGESIWKWGGIGCSFLQSYSGLDQKIIYGIAITSGGMMYNYNGYKDFLPKDSAYIYAYCIQQVDSTYRGITYGPVPGGETYNGYDYTAGRIDSVIYPYTLVKECMFKYEYSQPNVHSKVVPCYEIYFDYPVPVVSDTVFVGWKHRVPMALPDTPPSPYAFCEEGIDYDQGHNQYWIFGWPHGWPNYIGWESFRDTWGVVFPIVKLRCTTPRGLQVAQNEAGDYVAQWPADINAEDYEVAVCYTTQQPADDAVRYIPANGLSTAIGHLSPDTTYRIHLRKRCSYTTSGYSDTVASDWSAPVIVAASTGINAASDRRLHFGVQPNPASGSATVELDGDTEGTLTLTDLFGRTLTTMAVHAGTTTAALDLGGLPAGLYLLQLTTKDAMATRRLSVR